MEQSIKIGELSDRTGVSVRSLRYYEEKGALCPERKPSGYRIYAEDDIRTVGHIQALLSAGLGMELIAEILSCMSGETLLLDGCRVRLEVERHRMASEIDRISNARILLDALLSGTPAGQQRVASP